MNASCAIVDDGAQEPEVGAKRGEASLSGADENLAFAAQASVQREQAWDLAREPFFGELKLHPWSRERHLLVARLIAADVPAQPLEELRRARAYLEQRAREEGVEDEVSLSDVLALDPYVPTAEKVLFVAAHTPQEWAHLRGPSVGRFLAAISQWAEEAIPPALYEQACLTALQILTQHEQMIAMPQPSKRGKSRDLGN